MTDGESKEINEWALDYYNLYVVGYVDVFVLPRETRFLSPKPFSSKADRSERPVYRTQRSRHDPKTKLHCFGLGFCSTY